MGILSDLARRAGIGGTTLETIETLERHPEALAAGALGAGAAGVSAIFPGMGVHRPGLGIIDALTGHGRHPHGPGPGVSIPGGFGKSTSPTVRALMSAMDVTGRTVEGLQPWHVSGYKNVASASVIAASADITDLFASAQTLAFSSDDTFPWTFLCKRFRCALVTEPVDPGTEDGAWMRQLSLRFAVATEVGRISIDALGVDRIIEAPLSGSGGGMASQIFPNPGVPFPVIFEKNGTYQMFLRTDKGITLTKAITFTYQMDGWVVQNTSALGERAVVAALGQLLGEGTAAAMARET